MIIREEQEINVYGQHKVIVLCDNPLCKQPSKEFKIYNTTQSIINNYFICPSCVQLKPKTKEKLSKSATNQWKTMRDKMIDSINNGNSEESSKLNKSKASKNAWSDPIKRKSMMSAREPGTKYYENIKKFQQSKEYKESISLTISNLIISGKVNPHSNYKHGYFYSHKNEKEIYYLSSLELDYLKLFEEHDSIIKYIPHPFRIPYFDLSGTIRNYIPDFLIETNIETYLVEIKPKGTSKLFNNLLKIKYAKPFCKNRNIKYKVLTEKFCNLDSVRKIII